MGARESGWRLTGLKNRQLEAHLAEMAELTRLDDQDALTRRAAYRAIVVMRRAAAGRGRAETRKVVRLVFVARTTAVRCMIPVTMLALDRTRRVSMIVQQATRDVGQRIGRREQDRRKAVAGGMDHFAERASKSYI